MKKTVAIIIFMLFVGNIFSQTNTNLYRHKIALNCGSSIMGIVTNNLRSTLINNAYASPIPQLSYTFSPDKNFGFGPSVSYQLFKLDFLPINQQSSGVLMNINRLNFSFNANYYIVNNESLTLYAGVRFGFTYWKGNVSFRQLNEYMQSLTSIPMLDEILEKLSMSDVRFSKLFFSYQLLAGTDVYFTKNIGMRIEFAIGSPYWALAGINYRF